jgi:hypothetical protein
MPGCFKRDFPVPDFRTKISNFAKKNNPNDHP